MEKKDITKEKAQIASGIIDLTPCFQCFEKTINTPLDPPESFFNEFSQISCVGCGIGKRLLNSL
ncbi:hypothetical protein HYT92_01585 [Candidatus Pacearchaeota archaeon]|nr:hypothetical protein [Candidatus Pacearchaeota archaeon]